MSQDDLLKPEAFALDFSLAHTYLKFLDRQALKFFLVVQGGDSEKEQVDVLYVEG